jgi:plastocyanin
MKKILLNLFAAAIIFTNARATTFTVTVSNFQFSPASVNAAVGDTIKWVWMNGSHTTTSRTDIPDAIPTGAAPWNSPMNSSNKTFSYRITVAGTYNYWCAIHTTAMEATINATGSLAVVFSGFNISATSNNTALINWQTVTETNTAYYSVRRSYDAKNFAEIGRVEASGNSEVEKNYSFSDNDFNTADKYIYYEIVVVNKDGSTQLSAIKMFQNNNKIAVKLITSLNPNPLTGGHLMLQFNADKAGEMQVEVFDALGKLAYSTELSAVPGLNNGHLMMMNLMPGTYNIVFFLNGVKETHSVVIQ